VPGAFGPGGGSVARALPIRASPPPRSRPGRHRFLLVLVGVLAATCNACGREEAEAPPAASEAPPAEPTPRRALWVLCEGSQRVLEHPEKIPVLLEQARALGATDLFVQVYRGGRAWFDSSLGDASPWRGIREQTGEDTLLRLLREAHAAGFRVHAWVNVLSLARNAQAPLIRELGREAVLVDQDGRSLLDYPGFDVPPPDRRYYRLGTPAVWVDPAAPGVAPRLAETFAELVARYRELDGLHLDYIRYPGVLPFSPGSRFGVGLDLGHGESTRARFRAETGLEAPRPPDSLGHANRWDEWRRDKVTQLVRSIADASHAVKPDLEISAAVWAFAERAYLSIGQDWRRWLEEDLLDFAVPMAYTLDPRLFRYHAEAFAGTPEGRRIWLGIGVWLFAKRPAGAVEQVRLARAAGVESDALFSWDFLADTPALLDALVAEGRAAPDEAPAADRAAEGETAAPDAG
jgi:uncharacterized lipoprotein YddW (UPF0748 family)